MAPFGRHFLKARLKNRSASKDIVSEENEIQVWVCQEEKVVSGLTKHTTCADVVQALLEDHKTTTGAKRVLVGNSREFCLLERWKGFERALPPLSRILRLWKAWGDEKPYLQFILVRTADFVPHSGWRTSEAKAMPANQKQWDQGPAQYVKSLPVDKQKRMVKKAFRKLEKLRKETARQEKDGLEPVVQLIVSQDHMIREQIQRMRELDLEIEKLELDLRMNEEKTELDSWGEAAFSSFSETMDSQASESPSKDLLYIGDGFGQLDEQLKKHRDLIGQLSNEIDKEIESIWVQDTEEPEGATASFGLETEIEETAAELQNIKTDLENSMYKGLSIHTQLTEVQKELKQHDLLLQTKNQECEHLAAQLSSLQVTDSVNHICSTREKSQTRISTVQSKLCQKLSKTDVTDTDSDTGISSTHSQDSLSPCGELSLPSF